jgi:hypothetical protein
MLGWILLVLGGVMTALKLSLLEKRRFMMPLAVSIGASPMALLPWSVGVPWPSVLAWSHNLEIVQTLCILLTVDSVALLLLGLHLMHLHHEDQRLTLGKAAALAPSIGLLVGLTLSQLYGFHAVSGLPFFAVAAAIGAVGALGLLLVAFACFYLIGAWVTRLELLVLLAFGQLLIAMFLPLLLGGVSTPDSAMRPDWLATVLVPAFVLSGTAAGWWLNAHRKRHA